MFRAYLINRLFTKRGGGEDLSISLLPLRNIEGDSPEEALSRANVLYPNYRFRLCVGPLGENNAHSSPAFE
jgi:hypothetical protein